MVQNISENGRLGSLGLVGIISFVFILGVCTVWHFLVANDSVAPDGREFKVVLQDQADQIHDLEVDIASAKQAIDTRKQAAEEADVLKNKLRLAEESLAAQTKTQAELTTGIRTIGTAIAAYKDDYHASVWKAATGEQLPSLVLKSGRRYENVTITKVSAEGLEIRHQDGLARIPATELDSTWQKRFDWTGAAP